MIILSYQFKQIHGAKDIETGVLITLSDCNYIKEELNSDQFVGVIVNKEYFFTNRDIRLRKNIHTVKQDKVLKESTWFQRTKICPSPSCLIPVQPKILEEFENVLLNGVEDRCASLANPLLLVSDLALLVGHQWLSLEVIEEFITKINPIGNQCKVLSFIALKQLEKGGHLVEHYTYWKEKGLQNLRVIVNLGRNKLNEIYLCDKEKESKVMFIKIRR